MNDVTRILKAVEEGDQSAGEELFSIVYGELRRLAADQMRREAPGHTLQATALVHEAWLRLIGPNDQQWSNRAHFFGAAAEAMRRVLVDHARRKHRLKRGGGQDHQELDTTIPVESKPYEDILSVHEALDTLALEDPIAADLVKLRYFVGMTMEESAAALGLSKRTAEGLWTFARHWLRRTIDGSGGRRG